MVFVSCDQLPKSKRLAFSVSLYTCCVCIGPSLLPARGVGDALDTAVVIVIVGCAWVALPQVLELR